MDERKKEGFQADITYHLLEAHAIAEKNGCIILARQIKRLGWFKE